MKKYNVNLKNNWWIWLICILLIYFIVVSLLSTDNINSFTTTLLGYLNSLITPLGIILGLVLGYPLLRKKLIERYVTEQLQIIHDNNRIVRKECVGLKRKYGKRRDEIDLTTEVLNEIVDDLRGLCEDSIDANQNVYKYSRLVLDCFESFAESVKDKIPNNYSERYYACTLFYLLHRHLEMIYTYASSIGYVTDNYKVERKPLIAPTLKRLVSEGEIYRVESIDDSLSHKHSSAMLVNYYGINNSCLNNNNGTLLRSCYLTAPTPSPLARILYSKELYLPLVLKKGQGNWFLERKLVLIGFSERTSTKIESGETSRSILCYYANITDIGFIEGTISNSNDLNAFTDDYLGVPTLDFSNVQDFAKDGENITFELDRAIAMQQFKKNKRKLKRRLKKEL